MKSFSIHKCLIFSKQFFIFVPPKYFLNLIMLNITVSVLKSVLSHVLSDSCLELKKQPLVIYFLFQALCVTCNAKQNGDSEVNDDGSSPFTCYSCKGN